MRLQVVSTKFGQRERGSVPVDQRQFTDLQRTSHGRRLLRSLQRAEATARMRMAAENRVTRAYRQAAVDRSASVPSTEATGGGADATNPAARQDAME